MTLSRCVSKRHVRPTFDVDVPPRRRVRHNQSVHHSRNIDRVVGRRARDRLANGVDIRLRAGPPDCANISISGTDDMPITSVEWIEFSESH